MATYFDTGIFSVQALDSSLLVGAKLYWYVGGTATPANTYTTSGLSVANSNPVVANAAGRFPAMWLAAASDFKYILTSATGSVTSPLVSRDHLSTPAAAPTYDPDLTDFLNGDEPLPLANGGTAATSAVDALATLGAMGTAGGEFTGQITRDTKGGYIFNSNSGMASGEVFLQAIGGSPPTMANGDWLAEY